MEIVELIKKVRKIEIKAKGKSQDIFSGAYHSAFKGKGMSFSETRAYTFGDDVRNIDWNVTARTGETQIKIFEEERELTIMLLIDISKSQDFGSTYLKKDLVAEVAGIIAINALKNGDKVGAILFSNKIEKYLPPKKGKKNILRIIREIVMMSGEGSQTDISQALLFLNSVQKKKSICFLFSDFIDQNYETGIKIIARKHDLIPVKINDSYEESLPDIGLVNFYDAESGKLKLIDTSDKVMRSRLAESYKKYQNKFLSVMRKYGIDQVSFNTEDDYIKVFIKFFKSR